MGYEEINIILSKLDWERLEDGYAKKITIYKESDLHHFFGDDPEKHIVRVCIKKIRKVSWD